MNGDTVNPMTPSQSGKSKSTSQASKHVQDVRHGLQLNRTPVEDMDALKKFPEPQQIGAELCAEARHSDIPGEKLQYLKAQRAKYASRNERTFFAEFYSILHSVSREVKTSSLHIPAGWEARDWAEDGLDQNHDKLFRPNSVPKAEFKDPKMQAIIEECVHISNPQPDLAYGKWPDNSCRSMKQEKGLTIVAQVTI